MAESQLDSVFIPALYKPASLLPIARHQKSLLYAIETYPVTIVIGQTGSGKTTQIPQFLERAGWCSDGKMICVTQVSRHVAIEKSRNQLMLLLASSSGSHYCCPPSCRRGRL